MTAGDAGGDAAVGIAIVETSRRDVDFLDGLRGRDVNSMVRQPDEDVGCAIHPGVVVVTVRAVDVEAQGPLRTVGDGVLESLSLRPGRGPGDQIDQALEISILIQRQILYCRGAQLGVYIGLLSLKRRHVSLDRNFLRDGSHL